MDADREAALAEPVPGVEPVDPAATAVPARKPPRPSGAAALLGSIISSAHADDSVKHDFLAMRAGAGQVDGLSALDRLAAPAESPAAAAPGGTAGAAQAVAAAPTQPEPPRPLAERVLGTAKAALLDVGGGIAGAPKHIVGGLLDAVNNAMDFAADAMSSLPGGYMQLINTEGEWDPKVMTHDEGRALQLEQREMREKGEGHGFTYNVENPDSITGNIIRGAVAFLATRKALAGNPASFAGNVAADAAAGAVGMNSTQARLSNIVDQVAPNAFTNFLKAKPEDEGTILGHIKSGLEMSGLGMAFTGIVKTLKAVKDTLSTTPAEALQAAGAAPEEASAAAAGGTGSGGVSAPAGVSDAGAAQPKSALDQLLAMESDIPWEQGTPTGPVTTGTRGAAAGAKALGGVQAAPDDAAKRALALGYPKPETGHPLAPAAESTPTVEVSPELKGRFEQFMAQERGDVAAPLDANGKPLAEMKSADFSATGANPVKVNLNAINGPDDLKDAISRVSAQIPAQAVRHNDAVLDAAQSLGMDADAFLAGPGRALSDTEVVGLRMVANDVARQALDHFKAAAIPGASEESKATALAAYAKFNDMIAYMEGAKAESGRGVQAWGIKVAGLDVPYADAVKRIAESAGEPGTPEFMERMGALDSPEAVASAARAARNMTARDWQMYGWYNALLGPKTVVKKGLSDTFMGLWNLATRYAAERFGPDGGVQSGETAALLQGYKGSFGDALALARKAFVEGKSQFHGGSQFLEAFDHGQALADSAPAQLADEAPTFAMRDFMKVAASPKSYLPTTWVGAIDDFATMLNYQAERHALAYRTAAAKGLEGPELEQAVASMEAATPSWLHKQAVAAAMQNTFKEPLTGIGEKLASLVDAFNIPIGHGTNFELPAGRILMPFVKIPTNILRWAYTNSPLPLAMPSSRISAELAAGGATRDLALARVGLGSALSISALGLTLSGTITGKGPSNPDLQRAWRAAGNEPHSIKIGDNSYSYNSLEPAGLLMGIIADTHDIMRFAKEQDSAHAALSLIFGTGEALMSKTYLEGIANFFHAMQNPDSEALPWFNRLIATVAVPNTVAQVTQAMDPWMRQHYGMLDAMEARLPYLSQGLPPQRTLWGDAIPVKDGYMPFMTGTAAAKMLSPITIRPNDAEPIDHWIFDHRLDFPGGAQDRTGLSRPAIVQNFSAGPHISASVELTPEQHDRLQVLAGNELKDPATKMGAKDTLNALVEGKYPGGMQRQWDNASDAERALVVQSVVNKFRSAAKAQLIQEYPDLQEALQAGFQARAAQLAR